MLFPLNPPATVEERDLRIMEMALADARRAASEDEVPVGALVVQGNRLLGRAGNQVERLRDATAHAEMLALTQAFEAVGAKRLEEAELYCTLEPCIQCIGAALHARVKRVVYGAADPKFGGVVSLVNIPELPGLNHRFEVVGGLLAEESAEMLKAFFQEKRKKKGE